MYLKVNNEHEIEFSISINVHSAQNSCLIKYYLIPTLINFFLCLKRQGYQINFCIKLYLGALLQSLRTSVFAS